MYAYLICHFRAAAICSSTIRPDNYGGWRGSVIQRILLSFPTDFAQPERLADACTLLVGLCVAMCRRYDFSLIDRKALSYDEIA